MVMIGVITLFVIMIVVVIMNLAAMPHFIVLMVPARIRSGFGLERSFARRHFRAKLLQHLFEDMVFGDAQESLADLHRHMSVAEMVSDPGKVPR